MIREELTKRLADAFRDDNPLLPEDDIQFLAKAGVAYFYTLRRNLTDGQFCCSRYEVVYEPRFRPYNAPE